MKLEVLNTFAPSGPSGENHEALFMDAMDDFRNYRPLPFAYGSSSIVYANIHQPWTTEYEVVSQVRSGGMKECTCVLKAAYAPYLIDETYYRKYGQPFQMRGIAEKICQGGLEYGILLQQAQMRHYRALYTAVVKVDDNGYSIFSLNVEAESDDSRKIRNEHFDYSLTLSALIACYSLEPAYQWNISHDFTQRIGIDAGLANFYNGCLLDFWPAFYGGRVEPLGGDRYEIHNQAMRYYTLKGQMAFLLSSLLKTYPNQVDYLMDGIRNSYLEKKREFPSMYRFVTEGAAYKFWEMSNTARRSFLEEKCMELFTPDIEHAKDNFGPVKLIYKIILAGLKLSREQLQEISGIIVPCFSIHKPMSPEKRAERFKRLLEWMPY